MAVCGQINKAKSGSYYLRLGLPKNKEGQVVGKLTQEQLIQSIVEGLNADGSVTLFLKDPRIKQDELAEKGIISAEQAEARKANIPDFRKYDVEISLKG